MPLVISTFNDYFFYLQYRRWVVPLTVKANKLALQYFASVYGHMETERLMPTHMVRFHEHLLQRKREQKNAKWEYENISRYSIYKIMSKLRAYIKRLESERYLWDLKPIDVPIGWVPTPIPKYLTKEELKMILSYLDSLVSQAEEWGAKVEIYNAYMYRAIVWFLYTTGLRNAELRNLKLQDISISEWKGAVHGKGNKYASITFSETTKAYLTAYLQIRTKTFPRIKYNYVFTPYANSERVLTEQGLNRMVKMIGERAWVAKRTNTHIYRHTLATHLIQDWYTIAQVRDKLRHSCISITNRYTHSNPIEQMSMTQGIDGKLLE